MVGMNLNVHPLSFLSVFVAILLRKFGTFWGALGTHWRHICWPCRLEDFSDSSKFSTVSNGQQEEAIAKI